MITCENLVKIYTQTGVDVVALQGLDLSVADGEIIGIVGESGSGKSTLLNVLGGLDRPSAGGIVINGQDLLKMTEKELDHYRCTQVGFVWQQTSRNLIPYLTTLENIELPMRLSTLTPEQRRARAEELLDTVGMGERGNHLPDQLSGGEQQRAAIAVALANQPAILLADEPTGELDTATANSIYQVLQKINHLFGTTILIVSHDPGISHQVGRVILIRDGRTSTETVRVQETTEVDTQQNRPQTFEELLMLDNAGRVQIPGKVLEALGIGGRVRLEIKDGDILLHPVDGHRRQLEPSGELDESEGILLEDEPLLEDKAVSFIQRVRDILKSRIS
jgi:ABC-type lipoprotein export system ATPase subunit/bifunctional DNA-binding transcriptional regulator/antitoxin component of YhaV-PrlF toxin-antitoxin module